MSDSGARLFGHRSNFPTVKDIYDLRGLTFFLSKLEPINPDRGARSMSEYGPVDPANSQWAQRSFWEYTNQFANILVRHHEVLAIMPIHRRDNPFSLQVLQSAELTQDEQEDLIFDNQMTISANYRPDDRPQVPVVATRSNSVPSFKPVIAGRVEVDRECEGSIAEMLMRRLLGRTKTKGRNSWIIDEEFADHCQTLVHLLKRSHIQTGDNTDGTVKGHAQHFWHYVVATSCAKIHSRFNRGLIATQGVTKEDLGKAAGRNFFAALAVDGNMCSARGHVEANHHENHRLGPAARASLDAVHKMLGRKFPILQARLDARRFDAPFYDMAGRLHFQDLVSCAITLVKQSLGAIKRAKGDALSSMYRHKDRKSGTRYSGAFTDKIRTAADTWDSSIQDLAEALAVLWSLVNEFGVFEAHLEWLAAVWNLNNCRVTWGEAKEMDMSWDGSNPGSVASIGPATDPSSLRSSPAASGYTTPATLSPTTTPTKRTSLHGLTAMTSPLVQALQDVVLERGADEIADADVDETAQYDCQCVAGHWAQGCSLWVNYVLLHTTAAFALRGCRHPKPEQMAVSAAIRSSKVEVIALETSAHDLYKTSIEDILADTFILNNEDYILTDAQRDTIRQWLTRQYPESVEKRNLLTSNRMEGRVPHCETVLTSLRYLAKEIKRKPLILVSEDEAVPVERKVELPAKAILDSCLDLKPALSVSKLCCPVCTVCIGPSGSLRHHIELWPGSHTTWSTLDMPNWVPDEVCQRALDAARRALGIRLRDIVLEAAGPTATRSPSPEVTGSSPVGGVDASYKHPLDYWVEDKGVGTLYPSGGLVEKATKADSETKADLNDPDHSAKSLSPVDRE